MKKEKGRCKNGHIIQRNKMVVLSHLGGVCLNCGHHYVLSSLPGTYTWDEHNKLGERFHVYTFASLLVCEKCHNFMTSIQVSCKVFGEQEEIWRKELKGQLGIEESEDQDGR